MSRVHHQGFATLSALAGLASIAAIGVAGWSFTTGHTICSLTGACSSGADATQQVTVASLIEAVKPAPAEAPTPAAAPAPMKPATTTASATQQCVVSAAAKSASGTCAKCAAKAVGATAQGAQATTVAAVAIEPMTKMHAKAMAPTGVINATCPGSGKPVTAGVTSTFASHTVGFCCTKCQAHFDADTAEARAHTVAAMLAAQPVNATCPGSGKAIDASIKTAVAGSTVGFCCSKCQAAFAAKPYEQQIAYLGSQVAAKTINDKCGTCKQTVNAAAGQVIFAGQRIGFGCAACKPKFEAMSQAEKIDYLAKLLVAKEARIEAKTADTTSKTDAGDA